MKKEHGISLASMIEDLRAEILKALQAGIGQDLQFRLKPIELELKIAITKQAEGGAGVKFWVLDVDGKGSYESATTHTLRFVLEPVGRDGHSEVLISDSGIQRPPYSATDDQHA